MKKLAIFAAAFVLTLGLAQCKKEQPNAQNLEGKTVHLTVNVGASAGSATNGSRADIPNPSTGQYDFKDGDKLYVGYNGAKVDGELTYNTSDNKFSGDITLEQNGNQPLHFYYLGGRTATRVDETQQYTIDISNQTSDYPVISYGTSTINYSDDVDSYTTVLLNKCALVKFNLANGTTDAVAVGGMMTKATIDFADPGVVAPSTAGEITLHTGASNTEKWAILLSQSAVDNAPVAIGNAFLGYTVGVPAIEDNDFAPEINTIDNSGTGNVIFLNRLLINYTAQNGQVLTGKLGANVQISIAPGATVTLDGVSINGENYENYSWAGITCLGNATIILKDGSENTVRGFNEYYPGIYVPKNYTLTIQGGAAGTGKLTASSNGCGAGIGGGFYIPCGNIEIQGGDITATGGSDAAGIGSGLGVICGTITISGGTVTATGGESAAGIGGGYDSSCVAITISGGTVKATGGSEAAGIGSGVEADCGDITITTGVTSVTATKGEDATNSIGAVIFGTCGTVTIGCTLDGNGNPVGGTVYPDGISESPYTYVPQP